MAAALKSQLFSGFQAAALLVLLIALAAETQMAQAQDCQAQLTGVNACAPFVLPGATNPSTDCCNALSSVQHDCLCSTVRMVTHLPSQCNLPTVTCA
ncbi:stamen-specific protein FIL1 isoform X1 [Tripterygium wilfordii]|uniref:Stamen-specific protein FIL1 isoform X1 n=1 Tax=Tripterygium wilfordii TaxID=458696 RepID=A0A7J7D877_TRIWF|nr:protein 108-like [Tripterygium wilfordii]KAF5742570.1 stamen-specific protein FIL1 isoform X1 [Tripterygium wilfordii]